MKKFILISAASLAVNAIVYFLPYGTFADIGSLPAHPLIVHSVVILLPLISLFILFAIFNRRVMLATHLYLIPVLALVVAATQMAKSSGDSLSAAVGLPKKHAEWGNNLVVSALVLLAILIVYLFFALHMRVRFSLRIIAPALILVAVANIGLVYVVGHSGAESVWKFKYDSTKPSASNLSDPISAAEVSRHNSAQDCWTIVDDSVYDVTTFVSRHPGGSSAIREMCGKNASEDYLSEHSGQREPEEWLASFKIGNLAQ